MELNAPNNLGACGSAQARVPVRSLQSLGLLTLAALGTASLGLIRYTDLYLYRAAMHSMPTAAWIPDARITSCLVAFALYRLLEKHWPTNREALQRNDVYWLTLIGAAWLSSTAIADFLVRVYLPPIHDVVEIAAFLMFGLMAEEFLFRGALFSVAKQMGGGWFAIFVTAIFFSLSHFQYHSYDLTRDAIAQVAYTLPMGVALGLLRNRSGRLWPAILARSSTSNRQA